MVDNTAAAVPDREVPAGRAVAPGPGGLPAHPCQRCPGPAEAEKCRRC